MTIYVVDRKHCNGTEGEISNCTEGDISNGTEGDISNGTEGDISKGTEGEIYLKINYPYTIPKSSYF